jgi:hypothetical protein
MAEAVDFTGVWQPFPFAKKHHYGYNNSYFSDPFESLYCARFWTSELSAQEASSKQNTEPRQMMMKKVLTRQCA